MKESLIERNERIQASQRAQEFTIKQQWPYELKIRHAEIIAKQFYNHPQIENCHVCVGGLDSITLLLFLRSIGLNVPAVSVSSLEDSSIQKIHKELGVRVLPPSKSKKRVINEYGFPIISKDIAKKISTLQNPTQRNITSRHAIITGETGYYGGYRKSATMQLPRKWLELFGGYENEKEGTSYNIPDFPVSDKCCFYLKEKPLNDYAKENNSAPYLGLMASEGGRREKGLRINGCNYVSESTKRSAPFAIFSRQDLLRLALDLKVPVPEIYGEIINENGILRTTKAQRTGCSMCGFGIHLETRPHRFDLLKERNYKEWYYWMYECYTDKETGQKFGWGHVLDYIGVEW